MNRPGAGATDLNVGVKMSLPIGYPWRQGEGVDAARADQSARTAARQLAIYQVETEVRKQYALYQAALAEETLFRDRILKADRTALNSAQSAYESGRADIFVPIEAITMLFRDQAALDRRRSARIGASARSLAAVGQLATSLNLAIAQPEHDPDRAQEQNHE